MRQDLANARLLSNALEATDCNPLLCQTHIDYTCVSTIHHQLTTPSAMLLSKDDPEKYVAGLPVVSFHLTDQFRKDFAHVKQASISTLLRVKGWILPNYPLPPNEEKTEILRAVIRESFSASISLGYGIDIDMVDKLIEDIVEVTETLMAADVVDIEAFAHPDTKPTLNMRIAGGEGKWAGWGKWGKEKAEEFRSKMREQEKNGLFRRGVC
jgi:glutamate decarboxylase